MPDITRVDLIVIHVQLDNIVHDVQVVVVVVQTNQAIRIIQVMQQATVVVGHVMRRIINTEVHVIHVLHDNIVMLDLQVVVVVQINQVIHIILEIQRVIVVHGNVILDTI